MTKFTLGFVYSICALYLLFGIGVGFICLAATWFDNEFEWTTMIQLWMSVACLTVIILHVLYFKALMKHVDRLVNGD
jgi:hypothetical protein